MTDPGAVMPLFFMGLIPVFVDHDVDTMLMSPEAIEAAITKRTGAIIATHLYGFICDMDTIQRIARAHGIPVIGDASQAHAGKYHGSLSAPFGDIGAVSTMAWKHMTTGGQGGFLATDREDLYWAAKRFADRGKPFNQDASSNTGVGLNYRMTELAAVVGRVQLRKLSDVADDGAQSTTPFVQGSRRRARCTRRHSCPTRLQRRTSSHSPSMSTPSA